LSPFVNEAVIESCMHRFCFDCILKWGKLKSFCPLCKKSFSRLLCDITSDSKYHIFEIPVETSTQTSSDPPALPIPSLPQRTYNPTSIEQVAAILQRTYDPPPIIQYCRNSSDSNNYNKKEYNNTLNIQYINGYRQYQDPNSGDWRYTHERVAEKKLGRGIQPNEKSYPYESRNK